MSWKRKEPSGLEKVLLKAIADSGMTQTELAARSGVSQGAISRFMDEDPGIRRTVTLPVADRLCQALGLRLVRAREPKGQKRAKRKKRGDV